MKLIDVEYTFDRGKALFYFTADGRVDFRALVKDLAAIFRYQNRTSTGGGKRRDQASGRLRLLRSASVLSQLSSGVCSGVHQDGKGAGLILKSQQYLRGLRPFDVLFEK